MGKHCKQTRNKIAWITEILEIALFIGCITVFYLIGFMLN